ncbi:MAG TPA: pirin family protein [Micropepsaceae bacterium]|nr:pirin family protein [Micropepsaceae bacterium]
MLESKTIDTKLAEDLPLLKDVLEVRRAPGGHWVGDGFPVRTVFAYDNAEALSPFLLLDYAGPFHFTPSSKRRGVGEHPHRGFETVTVVYSGEVEHRDSSGGGGKIGPGDVQWMTAGSGLVHEEMHTAEFTKRGGAFEAIQLWVNLPARLKMTAPKYQTLLSNDIPEVPLAQGAGRLRVIAGVFDRAQGPAETFTPMSLWDVRLKAEHSFNFTTADGHTAAVFVMKGSVSVNGQEARDAEMVILERRGEAVHIEASSDAGFLVLSGEPLDEPIVGYGPFVMNTEDEIRRAITDYQSGRMGHLG